jgi:hypothetical protein
MLIINTREDLDAIAGTAQYDQFMEYLKGSIIKPVNVQVYPEGYGTVDYTGETLEPIWETTEDLSVIERFGFTKADFNNL